jgi:hypothetical protein
MISFVALSVDSVDASRVGFHPSSMSCVRIFVNELHSFEWLGILLARIAVGLLFFFPVAPNFLFLSAGNRCAKR